MLVRYYAINGLIMSAEAVSIERVNMCKNKDMFALYDSNHDVIFVSIDKVISIEGDK